MSSKTTPLLAGQFVRLAKSNGPCMMVASVEPFTGLAWVSWRDSGDVATALIPLADLEPFKS